MPSTAPRHRTGPSAHAEDAPSAVDALAQALRQRILRGDFRPGEFLRDVKMAEEYETSRHTFRVAARMLAVHGLLRQIPNRGFFVPSFGPDDIVDITRLRGLLEGEAVRTVVMTGIIPQGAIEAVEVMRRAETLDNRLALVAADQGFHRSIVEACGSPRIIKSYAILQSEIELLLGQRQNFYVDTSEMADEHAHLLKSLRTRHYETARKAFLEHWNDLQVTLLGREAVEFVG